jgi:hypothetical protein
MPCYVAVAGVVVVGFPFFRMTAVCCSCWCAVDVDVVAFFLITAVLLQLMIDMWCCCYVGVLMMDGVAVVVGSGGRVRALCVTIGCCGCGVSSTYSREMLIDRHAFLSFSCFRVNMFLFLIDARVRDKNKRPNILADGNF